MKPPTPSRPSDHMGRSAQLTANVGGTELVLMGNRTAWWPDQNAILLADAHFGKAATFRKAGIPVPAGTTSRMLAEMSETIERICPAQLVILGDFVHSSTRAHCEYESELLAWRRRHSKLHVTLVRGNHDRHCEDLFRALDFDVRAREMIVGPLILCHDPTDPMYLDSERYCLGGHMHPGYFLAGRSTGTLPCFWQTSRYMIFPAFGLFTGLAQIRPGTDDKVYVLYKNEIANVHPPSRS
jgi:DNA ligase-associated metallophosphoesterase